MKKLAGLLLLLLVAPAWAFDYPYTAAIEVQNGSAGGSGTVVGVDEGKALVISCAHIFEGGSRGPFCKYPGDELRYRARVLGVSHQVDLSAMEIKAPPKVVTAYRVRAARESDGTLTAVGFPWYCKPGCPHYTTGKYSKYSGCDVYFAADPHVHSGFSGGGLFAPDGSFVGVVTGYNDSGLSIATSGQTLEKFVGRWLKGGK